MRLIGLRLCEHDSNISYFDGSRVRYFKSERIRQEKHHGYNNFHSWKTDFIKLFGDDPDDVDEIAIAIDPWKHDLPQEEEEFFPAITYNHFSDNCYRINHHYAHALSCWTINDKKPDVEVVIDGFGDMNNAWSVFSNGRVMDRGYYYPDGSIGHEMAVAGENIIGINYPAEQYDVASKLMGLQSYGEYVEEYAQTLPLSMRSIKDIFDIKKFDGPSLNWIRTVHDHIGKVLVDFFESIADTDSIITYSGGVAQNVVWNTLLKKRFPNLIIPPHCNDEGLSLGALEYLRIKNNLPKFELDDYPYCQTDIAPDDVPDGRTIREVVEALRDGKTVGWYQGHGEIGPRALGNRSLLINPMIEGARDTINKIKKREPYRPFGASVLKEHQEEYFGTDIYNPHMLYVGNTKVKGLESITHVDGTCRYQTVDESNPIYNNLLTRFYKETNCPVLLNTSWNINGKPIMGDPDDTLNFTEEVDLIVVGNQIQRRVGSDSRYFQF